MFPTLLVSKVTLSVHISTYNIINKIHITLPANLTYKSLSLIKGVVLVIEGVNTSVSRIQSRQSSSGNY